MCKDGAKIDYMVLSDYWNRGHVSAIAAGLVNRARKLPDVTRATALADPANAASLRVLLKNGFTFEKTVHVEEDDSDAEMYVFFPSYKKRSLNFQRSFHSFL